MLIAILAMWAGALSRPKVDRPIPAAGKLHRAALALLSAIFFPAAAREAAPANNSPNLDTYTFLLGPSSGPHAAERLLVTMQRKYVRLAPANIGKSLIELFEFSFALHLEGAKPAENNELGSPDVVIFTAVWEPIDGVKRRVDGTWLNHFSRYRSTPEHVNGLKVFAAPEVNDLSRLYVSDDMRTIIECEQIAGHRPMPCVLISNQKSNLTMKARFEANLLNRWPDIAALGSLMLSSARKYGAAN